MPKYQATTHTYHNAYITISHRYIDMPTTTCHFTCMRTHHHPPHTVHTFVFYCVSNIDVCRERNIQNRRVQVNHVIWLFLYVKMTVDTLNEITYFLSRSILLTCIKVVFPLPAIPITMQTMGEGRSECLVIQSLKEHMIPLKGASLLLLLVEFTLLLSDSLILRLLNCVAASSAMSAVPVVWEWRRKETTKNSRTSLFSAAVAH